MLSIKSYLQLSGALFFVVGLVHLFRLFTGWAIVLAGLGVPRWVSVLGVIIPWYLAYQAFTLAGKKTAK